MSDSSRASAASPVESIRTDPKDRKPEPGIALCLSGGGYRAMLFHVGSLWRLYETGILKDVQRISSVSGGSITAAAVGLKWDQLHSTAVPSREAFIELVVGPVRALARETIDAGAVIGGILLPGMIADKIEQAYRDHLFKDTTLQDLPDDPRFVINATNVQSGALWRFMKPYMRDYRVGKVPNPTVPLAQAVAASSAFPPVLSPMIMKLSEESYEADTGTDLQFEPYTTRVVLTDGGVYDNLGLETAWKRYDTILVSDAGGQMQPEEEPKEDWARHSYRVLNLIDNQVRNLRKRQVVQSYVDGERKGTYWGIRTDIKDYELADPLNCPHDQTMRLADTPTRLKRLESKRQRRLINWGYAVCDAAIRKHLDPGLPAPDDFPLPEVGVG